MEISIENELDNKRKFAEAILRNPKEPFKIASSLFGDDVGTALYVSAKWPTDLDVIRFKEELVEEIGEMAFLPTKADAARLAWDMASADNLVVDDRLKALRLYSDIRGFIDKQGTTINNNMLTSNKVMIVKDHGSAENWEMKLEAQQAKLIEDATARN